MQATGVGSMPGEDLIPWLRFVLDELSVPFLPELPARGVAAQMLGRSLGLLEGIEADLQPFGWRIGDSAGVDHRRAVSLLNRDLDELEETAHDHVGPFKIQVVGPWTLAATTELQNGEKVLADHGARRDLAESLAAGVADHVAALGRRLPEAQLVVQIDEPLLPAVLGAQVLTASGYATYRTIEPPEADRGLRHVVEAIAGGGAASVVHCCAPDLPVGLLRGVGFGAISFDLALAPAADVWAEAFEAGVDLWPGVLPSTDAPIEAAAARRRIAEWMQRLGFEESSWTDRLTLSPTCGLAGASVDHARRVLVAAQSMAD